MTVSFIDWLYSFAIFCTKVQDRPCCFSVFCPKRLVTTSPNQESQSSSERCCFVEFNRQVLCGRFAIAVRSEELIPITGRWGLAIARPQPPRFGQSQCDWARKQSQNKIPICTMAFQGRRTESEGLGRRSKSKSREFDIK